MNWLRGGNRDQNNDGSSTTPDADELRRRRLARMQESQAEQEARRRDFEERKAKWEAAKEAAAKDSSAKAAAERQTHPPEPPAQHSVQPAPASSSARAPPAAHPREDPPVEPQPKRVAPALPSVEQMVSRTVSRITAIAVDEHSTTDGAIFYPDLIKQLRSDAALQDDQPLLLSADMHADDLLLHHINNSQTPLELLFDIFTRCAQQTSEIISNRRLAGAELRDRRETLHGAINDIENRVMMYSGMLLNGAFMESDAVSPDAFAQCLMLGKVPAGFIRALISRYNAEDAAETDDLNAIFSSVFQALRRIGEPELKLSSRNFLNPLTALLHLLSHKELCKLLTAMPSFLPKSAKPGTEVSLAEFSTNSYLYPFFKISALPGAPVGQPPMFPEDPSIGSSMFPNPSTMDQTEVDGAVESLRSSLTVARHQLYGISFSLCKAGPASRNAMLNWFATVSNLNKKRSGMQPDPRVTSRDGFMMNVMHVLLKLCDPILDGGWRMLQKIHPMYPQSSLRVDYSEETRLAADTDMLNRWWVDQRNENAQESLTRQLEVVARESGMGGAASSSAAAGPSSGDVKVQAVPSEFSFVTECYWLTLRFIQLAFEPVINLLEEDIMRVLQRLREIIKDLEGARDAGTLPPQQASQLVLFKRRFDLLLQALFCYNVYVQDPELLNSLLRFVTANAEWLMKKLLIDSSRSSILPLPMPVDPTFASLPEHTVESMTTVLMTVMRTDSNILYKNSALLEDMVSFCIVGAASPLHVKNPYLRAKLVEFLSMIFPRASGVDEDGNVNIPPNDPHMESLFNGHELSRRFLPGALFRLYVDVEHTGSHTQFYDKFSIRYRIGSILESLWYMNDYKKSIHDEARDENRLLRFVNMVLNDANHLLDSVLDDLEEMHSLETLIRGASAEWTALSDEEKAEKQERLQKLEGSAKSYNQLANNNVKLLWLLTSDDVVKRVFLRDEMVSRIAEMLNYLLERLCGQRCNDLVVSDPEKVSWKPRVLLTRIMQTYVHFHNEDSFTTAVARDGRSYKKELFNRAIAISRRRKILTIPLQQKFEEVAEATALALDAENEAEMDLGEIPEEFLDPIMSSLMRNPVKLPTSGNVMDRAVISRILLSDKSDPFNRKLLTEDMLVEDVDLKKRIEAFVTEKRNAKK